MNIERTPIVEKPNLVETLGWKEEVALEILKNADKLFGKEKENGEKKRLPEKVTEISNSLFENEKGEIVPFRTKDVVFIPSHDKKGIPARIFCIGDIHSDSTGEKKAIEEFTKALNNGENAYFISLGDYVDRPKKNVPSYASSFEKSEQLDCFHRIIRTKLEYPERVITLGGNHEKDENLNKNYGFYKELKKISQNPDKTYQQYSKVFQKLPNAAILVNQNPKKCHFFVHAGIPGQKVKNLNEFVEKSNDPGLYWSDPMEIQRITPDGKIPNYNRSNKPLIEQGIFCYNQKAVNDFFKAIGINGKIIRGHETPDSGFKEDYNKVITIFSANRYGKQSKKGKYLDYYVETNEFKFLNLDESAKPRELIKEKEKLLTPEQKEKTLQLIDQVIDFAEEYKQQVTNEREKKVLEILIKYLKTDYFDISKDKKDKVDFAIAPNSEILLEFYNNILSHPEFKKQQEL